MAFNNIDAPGAHNRHNRRAVAAIQRKAGAESRLAAAQAKRQRKMARSFGRTLDRTITFYGMPIEGVMVRDPDGAYLDMTEINGQRQIVIAGPFKASLDHYVKAIGIFLKHEIKLVSSEELPLAEGVISDRIFTQIIVERVDAA